MIDDRRDPYELLLEARYAICNNTSIVAEAITYGLVTFVFDNYAEVMAEPMELIFRDYPDLCVDSADAIIRRIEAIESGAWRYPRKAYAGLTDITGANPFDVIRADLGLAAKQPAAADADCHISQRMRLS